MATDPTHSAEIAATRRAAFCARGGGIRTCPTIAEPKWALHTDDALSFERVCSGRVKDVAAQMALLAAVYEYRT